MRRVVTYFVWRRNWWLDRRGLRPQAKADVQSGANAYAERQALVFEGLARKFVNRWRPVIIKQGLSLRWPKSIDTVIASLSTSPPAAGEAPPSPSVLASTPLDATHAIRNDTPHAMQPTIEQTPAMDGDETSEEGMQMESREGAPSGMVLGELDEEDEEISDEGTDEEDFAAYVGPDQYDSD